MSETNRVTRLITATAIALALLGVIMVFSSSAFQIKRSSRDEAIQMGSRFLQDDLLDLLPLFPRGTGRAYSTVWFSFKQMIWAALGLVALLLASKIDYPRWQLWSRPLIALGLGLLLLVWSPLGRTTNSATSWIRFSGFTVQPAEFAKIILIVFLADLFVRRQEIIEGSLFKTLGLFAVPVIMVALVVLQPDLGMATLMVASVGGLWFLAGARVHHMVIIVLLAVVVMGAIFYCNPNSWRRIETFLDPQKASPGSRYQVEQARIAMAAGGLWGVGLGEGQQKMHFLPAPHTDFIFAVLAEELGFVWALAVLLGYAILIGSGFYVAFQAPDLFGTLLAGGLTMVLGLGILINIAVVTGSIPTTGLPLPLISYGGSSLLSSMIAIGILINVSKNIGGVRKA